LSTSKDIDLAFIVVKRVTHLLKNNVTQDIVL